MKTPRIAPLAALLFVLIAGCTDPAPQVDDAPSPSPTQEPSAPGEDVDSPPQTDGAGDDDAPSSDETSSAPATGVVIITTPAGAVEFTPTAVFCTVRGGELRHLIAKTNNHPPLLEITPGAFAMVKLQHHGAPEKSSRLTGIEYRPQGVTFTDAPIGAFTITGELACTDTAER